MNIPYNVNFGEKKPHNKNTTLHPRQHEKKRIAVESNASSNCIEDHSAE